MAQGSDRNVGGKGEDLASHHGLHQRRRLMLSRVKRSILRPIKNRIDRSLEEFSSPPPIPASKRPEIFIEYPALREGDVKNAHLFATRDALIEYLAPSLRGGTIAELGVMYGDFSDFLIRTLEPRLFVAFDIFTMHRVPTIWRQPSAKRFQGLTHREFYEKRFADRGNQVRCEEGLSYERLSRYSEATFDMIYVDAGHDYESVKEDARVCIQVMKPDGILIFNDYIRFSHYEDYYYGVVPVVNDLVVNHAFEIIGFALQHEMYADIAIRKRPQEKPNATHLL